MILNIAAGTGFQLKNVLTNSNDEFMKTDPKKANTISWDVRFGNAKSDIFKQVIGEGVAFAKQKLI